MIKLVTILKFWNSTSSYIFLKNTAELNIWTNFHDEYMYVEKKSLRLKSLMLSQRLLVLKNILIMTIAI